MTNPPNTLPMHADVDRSDPSLDLWLFQVRETALHEDRDDELNKESHRIVEKEDQSEIVSTCRELKSMPVTAAKNALSMDDDVVVEAIKSCAAEAAPSLFGAMVSSAAWTIIDEWLSRKRVEAVASDALGNIVVQPLTVETTAD